MKDRTQFPMWRAAKLHADVYSQAYHVPFLFYKEGDEWTVARTNQALKNVINDFVVERPFTVVFPTGESRLYSIGERIE